MKDLHQKHYEVHYMIGDSTSTYLLEFIDNKTIITDISDKPIMTNFYLSNVKFNLDGTVFTPRTQTDSQDAIHTNQITENGAGLERYNLMVNRYPTL